MTFIPERNTVALLRPTESLEAANNATKRDYGTPAAGSGSRIGLFQVRAGRTVQGEDGQVYTFDGVFYTHNADVKVNDQLTFNGEKFTVLGVENKYDLSGAFSHNEVLLTREVRR